MRASVLVPDGTERRDRVRRLGIMCAEVCEATCRLLFEEDRQDEEGIRVQLQWCRSVCLDCAHVLDGQSGAESAAGACRTCAGACTDFMASLN